MSRRLRSSLLVPVSLAMLLAGCGGGDDQDASSSAAAKPYVDAMTTTLSKKGSPFDEGQSSCFSRRLVDVIGVDKAEAAGTPEEVARAVRHLELDSLDISRAQGEEVYSNFDACGVDLRRTMMDRMVQSDDAGPEIRACLDEAISEERLEEFFVTLMVEGEDKAEGSKGGTELVGAMMGCMLDGMEQGSPEG